MNVSMGTEAVIVDDHGFFGLVDADSSTDSVMGEYFDSNIVANSEVLPNRVLAEATVESTPGCEGSFDGSQETDKLNWDILFDFTGCSVSDSNEVTVPETECSSPPAKKIITSKGTACVPQQVVSDIKGKCKEVQRHQFKDSRHFPCQKQSVQAPHPVLIFGAGDGEGSKDTSNKPSAPTFVFGSGMAPKCDFGSFNVLKLPGLYGVPPLSEITLKSVAVPGNKARLAKSFEEVKTPVEAELINKSQVPPRPSMLSLLTNPPRKKL
ncbi:hypothetical protein CLU79DRAFT_721142 [Phycomyces nitens]|nr:hypothetical protein CLU79DRAFT_721142 [Phycomyces nitens]